MHNEKKYWFPSVHNEPKGEIREREISSRQWGKEEWVTSAGGEGRVALGRPSYGSVWGNHFLLPSNQNNKK